ISPHVPVKRVSPSIVYFEPSASQLSSTSQRLCFVQNSFTALRLNGLPSVCATMTAFDFGLYAFSSWLTSILYCGTVTSTKTGTAPYCRMGFTVVGNPHATVITSSPFLICRSPSSGAVSVVNARRFAEEPEFTRCAHLTPIHLAKSCSNAWAKRPVVSQKSSAASVRC